MLGASSRDAGFSLIEVVMAMAIFGLVSSSLIGVVTSATVSDSLARQRSIALELAQQQVEYVRQLNYTNAGIQGGDPPGIVLATQSKRVMGLWYTLNTTIQWVDDPTPTSASTVASYKCVRVTISRASDGKQLADVSTYLSSPTRDPYGGLDNAVINVRVRAYKPKAAIGGAKIDLTKGAFHAINTTNNEVGNPAFGVATFSGVDPTLESEYYEIAASLAGYVTEKGSLPPNVGVHFQIESGGTGDKVIEIYKPSSITVRIMDENPPGELYTDGPATVTIGSASRGGSQSFTTTDGTVLIAANETLAGEPIVPGSDYDIKVDTPTHRHGELLGQTVPDHYPTAPLSSSFDVVLKSQIVPQNATLTVLVRRVSGGGSCSTSTQYLSGASVTIDADPNLTPPYSKTLSTNAQGQAVFNTTPFGTYDISVTYYSQDSHGHTTKRTGGLQNQPVTVDPVVLCVPLSWSG